MLNVFGRRWIGSDRARTNVSTHSCLFDIQVYCILSIRGGGFELPFGRVRPAGRVDWDFPALQSLFPTPVLL